MTELAIKQLPTSYQVILADIDRNLPAATYDAQAFHKSSSQFKAATLDVVDLTPITSARHLLAVITRTRAALEEASVSLRRKELERQRKEAQLLVASGDVADELLIDLDELRYQITNAEDAMKGAVRRLGSALNQYQGILNSLGKTHLTESDYEDDQARYHLMTAFNQALSAARSRGGLIDEGNHIYLMQLGVNGAVAQAEITALLNKEQELLQQGNAPSHEMIVDWLEALADRFIAAPAAYAERRYLTVRDDKTILEVQDDRHLPIEH